MTTRTSIKNARILMKMLETKQDFKSALAFLKNSLAQDALHVTYKNQHGQVLLSVALENYKVGENFLEFAQLLIDQKMPINGIDTHRYGMGNLMLRVFCKLEVSLRGDDKSYESEKYTIDLAQMLLDAGGDVNIKDPESGLTCLIKSTSSPHYLFRQVFEKNTLDINTHQNPIDYEGMIHTWSAVHWAASAGHIENLQYLLDQGANFEMIDPDYIKTVLHLLFDDHPEKFKNFMENNPHMIQKEMDFLSHNEESKEIFQKKYYENYPDYTHLNYLNCLTSLSESMKLQSVTPQATSTLTPKKSKI